MYNMNLSKLNNCTLIDFNKEINTNIVSWKCDNVHILDLNQ